MNDTREQSTHQRVLRVGHFVLSSGTRSFQSIGARMLIPKFYLFKGLWACPKGGPSSRSTGNLANCCHETGEYRAMWNVPCTPRYRTAQNEQVVANQGGGTVTWKNERRDSERKKGADELCQLPTSLPAFTDQFREGKVYIHLKLNLAKQEASPN